MDAIIYCLKDPDTGEVRYVGKANNLKARLRGHLWEAREGGLQTPKARWLRKLKTEPVVEVLEIVPQELWAERERFWIRKFRDTGADLTNIADGGQTSPVEGRGHTAETKARLREIALLRGSTPPSQKGATPWNKGTKGLVCRRETSFVKGQTAWNKGKKMTEEQVEKNRKSHIGKPWTAARRAAQEARNNKTGVN